MGPINVYCLLPMLFIVHSLAFVDNYKWNYHQLEGLLGEVMKEADKYYSERQILEEGYMDERGRACVESAKKEKYNIAGVLLTSKMISVRQQFKKLDQDTFEETKKCDGDQQCVEAAYKNGIVAGGVLKTEAISSLRDFRIKSLQDLQIYLMNCVNQQA